MAKPHLSFGAGLPSAPPISSSVEQSPTRGTCAKTGGITETIQMLRLSQVVEVTGLGKTTVYALQKQGRFPKSVHLTPHLVRWVASEIHAWLAERADARAGIE